MILVEIQIKCNYYYGMVIPTEVAPSVLPAAPPPPSGEKTQAPEKLHVKEAPKIAKGSLRSRARQVENDSKKSGEPIKALDEGSLDNDLHSYRILEQKANESDQQYKPEQVIRQTARGVRLVLFKEGGNWRIATPQEVQNKTGTSIVTEIQGKKGDSFICLLDSGTSGQVPISTEVILDAQMAGIYREDIKNPKGVLSESERKTIAAHLETRYSGKQDALDTLDDDILREAAENSGQPFTDALVTFLTKQKITASGGKPLTAEETNFNKELDDRMKELSDSGIVAEPAQVARVMKSYGKKEIPQRFSELKQQRDRLAAIIPTLRPEEQAQAQEQLESISSRMLELTNAESGILSEGDDTLENFFSEDVAVDRGKNINRHLRNGSAVGAMQEVIDAKVDNMEVEEQDKWREFMGKVLSKGPIVGGAFGLLMVLLMFQSMQGKQQ